MLRKASAEWAPSGACSLPINRHFDLLAPLYDRLIPPPDPGNLRRLLDLPAQASTPAEGWMLDAGGGTGRVSAMLCPLVERLVVCDLSQPMLAQAVEKGCVQPAQACCEQLPFPDAIFQRILVVDAFHHFGKQVGALRELARVLRPGGRLVIEEPDIRRWQVKLIALGETVMLMGSRFRTPDWMREQMAACGLETRVETEQATAWVIGIKGKHANLR